MKLYETTFSMQQIHPLYPRRVMAFETGRSPGLCSSFSTPSRYENSGI